MAVITDRLITQMQLYGAAQFTNELLDVANTMAAVQKVAVGPNLSFVGKLQTGFGLLASNTKTFVGLGAIAGFQLYEIAKQVISVTAEFNNLENQLGAVYGSANKGHQAFLAALMTASQLGQTIQNTALAEQTSAFYGLNLTEKSLTVLSGISRMRNMGLNTIVKDLGLAKLGNYRALRQLGLSREDLPKNLFPKTGVPRDGEKAALAIVDILNKKFPEAVKNMNRSMEVAANRMKVSWETLLFDLGGGTHAEETQSGLKQIITNILKGVDDVVVVLSFAIQNMWALMINTVKMIISPKHWRQTMSDFIRQQGPIAKEFWDRMGGKIPDIPKMMGTMSSGGNTAAAAIREIIGGGMIAKIGIRPSELPGMVGMRKKSTIRVELSTTEGGNFRTALEEIIQQTVNAMNMHGSAPAGAGSSF